MKTLLFLTLSVTVILSACSSPFDEAQKNLQEKMHAEDCTISESEEIKSGDTTRMISIELQNVDELFFGHPQWMLQSFAAQEFYYDQISQVGTYDVVSVVMIDAIGNRQQADFPLRDLVAADTFYTRAERIINDQNGLSSIAKHSYLFDTIMPASAFPQIDSTIASSTAQNGPQKSIAFGGYRRVSLEYMNTPVFQVVVQQRRTSKTDVYLFNFSAKSGLIMSMQLNGAMQ